MKSQTFTPMVFNGGKIDGQTSMAIRSLLQEMVGKRVKIVISNYIKKRTNEQNDYWWAAIVPAVHEAFVAEGNNYDLEDTHYYLVREVGKFPKQVKLPGTGEVVVEYKTSSELDVGEFMALINKTLVWAAEHNIHIGSYGD